MVKGASKGLINELVSSFEMEKMGFEQLGLRFCLSLDGILNGTVSYVKFNTLKMGSPP